MNKCDFCEYSRPNNLIRKCGWTFSEPSFKSDNCHKAQKKFEKYISRRKGGTE